jgi:molybdopterin/thiamine biosynthesis adenylyltransferase
LAFRACGAKSKTLTPPYGEKNVRAWADGRVIDRVGVSRRNLLVYKLAMLYNSFMHDDIAAAIRAASASAPDGATSYLSLATVHRMASEMGLTQLEIECAALQSGIIPTRYQLNIGTIGVEGQLKLLRSSMGVCGLGGLGGHIVESLARFGVGHLILADGDVFEENNLNRQLLCTEAARGQPKAEAAAERVAAVNSSLEVTAYIRFVTSGDIPEVFQGADLVIDALDNVSSRLALEEGCARLRIPLVHGAIAGNSGQVMTIFPGDPGLKALYSGGGEHGVETIEGNPPTTPALVASLQVQEAVKIICGGEPLRHGFLLIDIASNLYQFIPLQ